MIKKVGRKTRDTSLTCDTTKFPDGKFTVKLCYSNITVPKPYNAISESARPS